MSGSLSIVMGDNSHKAVLNCLNLDGTPASGVGVSYDSDNSGVCAVQQITGVLTPQGVGTCTITGTGTRGSFSHTDSAIVTVTSDDSGDFTVSLVLS
jgi:hypothetical protein